ncbi:MAG: hypothetical protein BWK79_14375 [Beggiatoa sp. IS2]|nr:MAG: hypothetical protein BWK79_14375 [Beggiatoa sp. IS2]
MAHLAKYCAELWSNLDGLNTLLSEQFSSIPHCQLLYAVDKFGKQVSANVSASQIDVNYRGQDLSRRPYSVSLYPKRHFMLSSVYISQTTGHPCISAVQPVIDEQQFLGFVIADFDVSQLPLSMTPIPHTNSASWRHNHNTHRILSPQRVLSALDHHIEETLEVLNRLISEYGVFHCTLHCSSGQVMLWQIDNPYQYRLYEVEQLLHPEMYLAYPRCDYTEKAILSTEQVRHILERFRGLRLADDHFYLRAGSINIMNGLVGLSFSYDGSQYMPAQLFLSKELSSWFGRSAVNAN